MKCRPSRYSSCRRPTSRPASASPVYRRSHRRSPTRSPRRRASGCASFRCRSLERTLSEATRSVPPFAIVALSFGAFGAAASARVADPMLPVLASGYGVGIATAANVVTLFTLAYGVFQIALGPFGERLGKYRLIGWACATSAFTGLVCAFAPSFGVLAVGLLLAGERCAALVSLSMGWIGDALPYDRR